MAKLYFYYSSMNAGKSASLLQSSYNYQERGLRHVIALPGLGRSLWRKPNHIQNWDRCAGNGLYKSSGFVRTRNPEAHAEGYSLCHGG